MHLSWFSCHKYAAENLKSKKRGLLNLGRKYLKGDRRWAMDDFIFQYALGQISPLYLSPLIVVTTKLVTAKKSVVISFSVL
jgi:hypothetical protein